MSGLGRHAGQFSNTKPLLHHTAELPCQGLNARGMSQSLKLVITGGLGVFVLFFKAEGWIPISL